jgi:hypothetical protein
MDPVVRALPGVMPRHPRDLVTHSLPQPLGCEYLDMVPMAQDVHDELGRIGSVARASISRTDSIASTENRRSASRS